MAYDTPFDDSNIYDLLGIDYTNDVGKTILDRTLYYTCHKELT